VQPAPTSVADAALKAQVQALERRLAELGETLQKTRDELKATRSERPAQVPTASPAAASRPTAHNAAPAAVEQGKRRGAAVKAKLATLKKATTKK
jgi:hypothetical protein